MEHENEYYVRKEALGYAMEFLREHPSSDAASIVTIATVFYKFLRNLPDQNN